ncbi:MAG: hypothetical protein LBT46_15310 [Planctomycetaceae bacterium]|jgi:site-specific DNA-methyltransferase (adenine-specific)|nr:hypothetical protein [Planctomycetaceae bacterium]
MTPTISIGNIHLYNADCVEVMRTFPDAYFDIAIVDPPYGHSSNIANQATGIFGKYRYMKISNRGGRSSKYNPEQEYGNYDWNIAPPKEYFDELFRVSKKQIIWGGNYFELPPTNNFIIYDKMNISESFNMAI